MVQKMRPLGFFMPCYFITMKKAIYILSLCLTFTISFGQITIDFPINKAVYQRNNSNNANLNISGKYGDLSTVKIEVRLVNPATGIVISGFDWQTLVLNPTLGHYFGTLNNVPGGWYTLQTRNISTIGTILNIATVDRVGIGEVFFVTGQSNAEGFLGYGSVDAQSEKVVTHNYNDQFIYNSHTSNLPPFPSFKKIESNDYLSIKGASSWCYGRLGDLLTNRLGVPIAFFNSGASGTSVQNWNESSMNQPTYNEYTGLLYGSLIGMPYVHLRNSLKLYAQNFGVRSVLWHQGETDNRKRTSSTDYQNILTSVINQSRLHLNSNLCWVISRASYDNGMSSPQIIGGQNATIQQNTSLNFYGPETDGIQPRKNDNIDNSAVHFEGAQLIELANAYDASLNTNFFSSSTPIQASPLKNIAINCGSSGFQMSAPPGYNQYKWVRIDNGGSKNFEQTPEATTQVLSRSSGTYMCYLIDNQERVNFSQIVDLSIVNYFCTNGALPECQSFDYVSDLPFLGTPFNYNAENEFGPIRRNLSNSGNPITLNGVTYTKGFGVHAQSIVEFSLTAKNYLKFESYLGLDDAISDPNCGNVIFKVYGDNNLLYTSPAMAALSETEFISIPIAGYNTLKLEVETNGVSFCDHADWADTKLFFTNATQIPSVTVDKTLINSGQTVVLTASNCNAPNIVKWSSNVYSNPYIINPSVTQLYSASCITPNVCETPYSAPVTVNVIPDCANSYTLISPTNNFSLPSTDLTYKTSQKITGINKLSNAVKITYDAKQSIELLPGFIAENGTTFTAKIGGCNN